MSFLFFSKPKIISYLVFGACLTLSACATAASSQPVATPDKKLIPFTALIPLDGNTIHTQNPDSNLIQAANGDKIRIEGLTKMHDAKLPNGSPSLPGEIRAYCTGETGAETALIGTIAVLAIKPLIKGIFGSIDKNLEKKLKAYTQEHSASMSTSFYKVESTGFEKPVVSGTNVKCLRFVRGHYEKKPDTEKKSNATINYEFLVQVRLVGQNENQKDYQAMQLVPLMVYTDQPSVEEADKVAYALSVKLNGIQSNLGSPITNEQFNYVMTTGKYKPIVAKKKTTKWKKARAVFKYWGHKNTNTIIPSLPLLPLPGQVNNTGSLSGLGTMTFKLVETGSGRRKASIEKWKSFLNDAKDDVADSLSAAASELVNSDDDDDTDTEDTTTDTTED